MRYLILESDWTTLGLSQDIGETGVLLTRTDRPEDIRLYLDIGRFDLILLSADQMDRGSLTPAGLRALCQTTPIAIVTSDSDTCRDTDWLMRGADMVLPVSLPRAELLCRLSALARRAHGLGRSQITHGPLTLNLDQRRANILGCPLQLAPKLYELLEFIALRPGQLVSRDDILTHIYGLTEEPESRVFDVYLCALRACLKPAKGTVEIETRRGAGIRLVVRETPPPIAA